MFRRFLSVIICVFLFSILHVTKLVDSHPNQPAGTERANKYNLIVHKYEIIEKKLGPRQTKILESKIVITDLNKSWADNEGAIKAGNSARINAALNTFLGAIAAIPTGGTSALATLASYGPTFLNAYQTYKGSSETGNRILNRVSYIKAFETVLAGYDAAVAYQKSQHDEYLDFYFQYLQMEVDHDGGLYIDANSSSLSVEQLYSSINGVSVTIGSDGSRVFGEYQEGVSQKTSGYYHLITDRYGDRLGTTNHLMDPHLHWNEVSITPLAYDQKCKGSVACTDMHRTAYEAYSTHLVTCADYNTDTFTNVCSETWYSCASNHSEEEKEHKVYTCKKIILEFGGGSRVCGAAFKPCLLALFDHNETDSDFTGTHHSNKSDPYVGEDRISEPANNTPDCDTCTSECSTCSNDGGESTSTDGSHDCASCTSTSECSACDTTDTSTSTSDSTSTDTTSTSTSTPTAPGLYPVGASLATVNGQQMPSLAPGDSHTAKLITKSGGYAIVHWYLLPPGIVDITVTSCFRQLTRKVLLLGQR